MLGCCGVVERVGCCGVVLGVLGCCGVVWGVASPEPATPISLQMIRLKTRTSDQFSLPVERGVPARAGHPTGPAVARLARAG